MTPKQRVERVEKECEGVYAQCGVNMRDREFMASMRRRETLSPLQEAWLRDIETRVFGDEAEEE